MSDLRSMNLDQLYDITDAVVQSLQDRGVSREDSILVLGSVLLAAQSITDEEFAS